MRLDILYFLLGRGGTLLLLLVGLLLLFLW